MVFTGRWSLCTGSFSTGFNENHFQGKQKMWSLKTGGLALHLFAKAGLTVIDSTRLRHVLT